MVGGAIFISGITYRSHFPLSLPFGKAFSESNSCQLFEKKIFTPLAGCRAANLTFGKFGLARPRRKLAEGCEGCPFRLRKAWPLSFGRKHQIQ
jgi:hypothetical protein